jgi:hypothetical protein
MSLWRTGTITLVAGLLVLALVMPPSLMTVRTTMGRPTSYQRERQEVSPPGALMDPKRLPRVAERPPVAIPRFSETPPDRLRQLKRQVAYPGAPATLVRERSAARGSREDEQPRVLVGQRAFEGLSQTDNDAAGFLARPPDPDIAAGPNHVGHVVNRQVRFSTKDGTTVLTSTLAAWFANVAAACGAGGCSPFDPRIAYDPHENRWIIVALHLSTSPQISRILVSVSTSSNPLGTWHNYNLDGSLVYPPTGENTWADYPDVGFDGILSTAPTSGAIYITANMFTFSPFGLFRTARLWILSKAQLYAGAGLTFNTAWDRLDSGGAQASTLRAAKMYSNPGVMYLINSRGGGWTNVSIWTVTPTYPPAAVIWTLLWTTSIGSYSVPPDAAQLGCTSLLDTLNNRMYNAVFTNNRIYAAFTEANGAVSNIRYLRIRTTDNVVEANVSFGSGVEFYFFPAVAVDSVGNVGIVFARSGSGEFASVRTTGHLAGASVLDTSQLLRAGEQCIPSDPPGGVARYGDYFGAAVDVNNPTNRRLWAIGEYSAIMPCCPDVWDWGTFIGRAQHGAVTTGGLYNPATSTFYLRNSNTAGVADLTFPYGPAGAGWIPVVGDWNGDGVDTVGLYNPATSTFYLRNSNTAGVADITFQYGPAGAGWIPVVGDWNGDGVDTVGLYNPATSTFYLRNSNTAGVADLTFPYGPAGAGWMPRAGDWDGG